MSFYFNKNSNKKLLFIFLIFFLITSLFYSCGEKQIYRNDLLYMDTTDTFLRDYLNLVQKKNVCLLTNATTTGRYLLEKSVDPAYSSRLHEIFAEAKASSLKIITPEHGLFTQEENLGNSSKTSYHMVSVHGKNVRYWEKILKDCHLFLISLPDSGIRPYTYRTNIVRAMKAIHNLNQTKQQGFHTKEGDTHFPVVWVLDHPNPAAFLGTKGFVAEKSFFSYIGEEAIPFFPGYTYGELARRYQKLHKLNIDLNIIHLTHYQKTLDGFIQSDYFPPSPSLPDKRSLACYWVTIYFESTIVDEGRFSKDPFCLIGHPAFRFDDIPPAKNGVRWEPILYYPFGGKFAKRPLPSFRMQITDWEKFNPIKEGYEFFLYIKKHYFKNPKIPFYKKWGKTYSIDQLMGTDYFRKSIESEISFENADSSNKKKIKTFKEEMKKLSIY